MKLKITAAVAAATLGLAACSNMPGAGPATGPAASGINSSAPNAVSEGAAGSVGGANHDTGSNSSNSAGGGAAAGSGTQ